MREYSSREAHLKSGLRLYPLVDSFEESALDPSLNNHEFPDDEANSISRPVHRCDPYAVTEAVASWAMVGEEPLDTKVRTNLTQKPDLGVSRKSKGGKSNLQKMKGAEKKRSVGPQIASHKWR